MKILKNLMKPITFGRNFTVSNRMYFSSVGFDLCDKKGQPLPEFLEIYESIMDGGCGFGFLGNASIDLLSQYNDRGLKLVTNAHAKALLPLFKKAEKKKVPLVIQLQHYGAPDHTSSISSSTSTSPVKGDVTFLAEDQIEKYINYFHDAACRALDNGITALQIHAANGYLLSSFLSPRTNRRTDRWGGSPIKRARILLEILRRIRASVQDRMVIFVRLQVNDGFDGEGLHVELLEDVVKAIEESGANAITCATGVADTFGKCLGNSTYTMSVLRHAAKFIKSKISLPIGFAANIDSLEIAEEILESGDADFIGFGRAIIADHQFVNKELSGQFSSVNRCHWDSYCLRDKKEPLANRVFCCVNPLYLRPQYIQKKYQEE